ncbi:hypothetical protein TNCV_2147201 [Trichonephila clavipes]|uniref:Uncharacterized protein n=1 Tax=Trichonephila clavipes TaxID=2585209 RepID=A0A8X6SU20_TRICX|nr:hypothetical protein TNCV_2147201 [Trichonephila clavipes]
MKLKLIIAREELDKIIHINNGSKVNLRTVMNTKRLSLKENSQMLPKKFHQVRNETTSVQDVLHALFRSSEDNKTTITKKDGYARKYHSCNAREKCL